MILKQNEEKQVTKKKPNPICHFYLLFSTCLSVHIFCLDNIQEKKPCYCCYCFFYETVVLCIFFFFFKLSPTVCFFLSEQKKLYVVEH